MTMPKPPPSVRRALAVHGLLDILFAAAYAWVGFVLAPGRSTAFNVALGAICALLAVSGILLLCAVRVARPVALATSLLLLLFSATVVALLVSSAAYLRGIYGPLGLGMSIVSILVASLVVQFCAFLPYFQICMLFRDDVKIWFVSKNGAKDKNIDNIIIAENSENVINDPGSIDIDKASKNGVNDLESTDTNQNPQNVMTDPGSTDTNKPDPGPSSGGAST